MDETLLRRGAAGSSTVRLVNRSMVIDCVRSGGPVSRFEIARRTGLSKPTACSIVDDLIREDALVELPPNGGRQRGRPPRLLMYNERTAAFVGIEIGATTVHVGVGDAVGRIVAEASFPTPRQPRAAVHQAVARLRELVDDGGIRLGRVCGAGVAVAGLVDPEGRVVQASRQGWHDVPLAALVEGELGVPVVVLNRVAAATLAEGRRGAAMASRSYVWVYTGTGIGAGLVVDGQLVSGFAGFAGELGHTPAADDGELCVCGNRGCLETVAGADAIAGAGARAAAGRRRTLLRALPLPLDAAAVASVADRGDAVAIELLRSAGTALGLGVAFLVNILNPSLVVIGGPLSRESHYLDAVRGALARHTLSAESVPVAATTLGPAVSLQGTILAAMERHTPSLRVVGVAAASA